jgi:Porin subfamily
VKICTLYGAGFYYLPGTDICVKHGAYVRAQFYYNAGAAPSNGPFSNTSGQNTNFQGSPNDLVGRARSIYTLDARTQTEYGTLRGYVLIGFTQDWPANSLNPAGNAANIYATRGFIQFAGFTLGKATSFYDIYSAPATSYFSINSSDTGDAGQILAAYTFQFGNGFSATIAAEDPRRTTVVNTSISAGSAAVPSVGAANPFLVGAAPIGDPDNVKWPDIVANLRVDQAWGSFQVMGAIHDSSGAYFANGLGVTCNVTAVGGTLTGQLACGHPDDELGFAVGVGGIFRIPMPTGLTDIASFQVNYTEGAVRYVNFTSPGSGGNSYFTSSNFAACPSAPPVISSAANGLNTPTCLGSIGLGYWTDGIYGNPGALLGFDGSIRKTKAWGVNASWDHLWTPNLKSSIYASYVAYEYNNVATGLIANATCGTSGTASNTLTRMTNCDPDFNLWQIGSRTQWNITPSFYVGFDVMYEKIDTAFAGAAFYTAATGQPRPSGNYSIEDQENVKVTGRAHWDILP